MSISNNQVENKYEPWLSKNDFYSLSSIFGFSSKTNYSISFSKENGLISLIAGPYIILYDLSIDKQISFIKNPNNKIISCLRFNEKGDMLATGEGNCKNGEVRLYQIDYNNKDHSINFKSVINYKVHKFGIDKILFIRNDEYILSIGNKEDKTICLMDLKNKQNFFLSKFNRPILSCDVCDNFMILCGNKFIKFYNYENYFNTESREDIKDKNLISKYLVELNKLKECSFVSVVIDKNNNKIFFITYNAYLVEMKSDKLLLNRWVHLKASKGLSLILFNDLLGCGCSDGLFRIFTTELKHVCTLKYPPPLSHINTEKEIIYNKSNNYIYADIVASLYNSFYDKLFIIYSDRSLIIWDISNYSNVELIISKISHSGGIKAMDYFLDKENSLVKIITCSDDKTVIYWNIPISELLSQDLLSDMNKSKYKHIYYSKYIRHIFYLDNENNFLNFKAKEEEILSNSNINSNKNINNDIDDEYNLTSVRFSPCGNYAAIGDNFGNIQIYSLINFQLENKIEAHNGEINSIDIIQDEITKKIYLSSGSSDNFVSLIDMSQGWSTNPINEDKTEMEKMSSPVISVVFCIDKNSQLKLIVGEQNSTITFFLVNNGILQTLQKNYENNLKTYCLSYSPAIKRIISGHNGKISIWKTSTNIAHKHFQVNRGDKLLDNFRIASDNSGLIFATYNDDKFIRVRALHDGKLLAKIQVSESISNLFFILEDNYLIASSIEGYIYFYKLNTDLIKKLQKDNELKNSTEEKNIITNKLLLLQKIMESDTSLSKNNQVKNLLKKFQQSEETTFEDLKILDGFVKEGKKNLNKKAKEIELKEEKNDFDENNHQNDFLNKSNIFEKGLRNRISTTDSYIQKKNMGRISLTDNYNSKQINNKNKEKENNEENNKEEVKNNNEINIDNEFEFKKKFSNININQEFSNNNRNKYNNENINKDEIKEEIEETPSIYQPKIIENSQTQLSETHINNLKITQTTNYGIKSFNIHSIKKVFEISKENIIYFEPEKKKNNLIINNINNIEFIKKIDPKTKLLEILEDNNFINNIKEKNDLKEIEIYIEKLLSQIRFKIGKEEKDIILEKMADKYSQLILEKIQNKIKNNFNKEKQDNKDDEDNKENNENKEFIENKEFNENNNENNKNDNNNEIVINESNNNNNISDNNKDNNNDKNEIRDNEENDEDKNNNDKEEISGNIDDNKINNESDDNIENII